MPRRAAFAVVLVVAFAVVVALAFVSAPGRARRLLANEVSRLGYSEYNRDAVKKQTKLGRSAVENVREYLNGLPSLSVDSSPEEIERAIAGVKKQTRDSLVAIKRRRREERQATKRAKYAADKKEAAEKKRLENHAKILLGVVAISLAQQDDDLRARIEAEARHFYEKSPGRLDAALNGLALTVARPESEAYDEKV